MEKIKRKELYRLPISPDILQEVFEIGALAGKRQEILNWILYNRDLSDKLKISWCEQYLEEFQNKLWSVSEKIRRKLNLLDLENVITPDTENEEIVVLDITRKEYESLCKKYNYLCKVVYGDDNKATA